MSLPFSLARLPTCWGCFSSVGLLFLPWGVHSPSPSLAPLALRVSSPPCPLPPGFGSLLSLALSPPSLPPVLPPAAFSPLFCRLSLRCWGCCAPGLGWVWGPLGAPPPPLAALAPLPPVSYFISTASATCVQCVDWCDSPFSIWLPLLAVWAGDGPSFCFSFGWCWGSLPPSAFLRLPDSVSYLARCVAFLSNQYMNPFPDLVLDPPPRARGRVWLGEAIILFLRSWTRGIYEDICARISQQPLHCTPPPPAN